MHFRADDRGSVTAEFAVALPAVLGCLALCVGVVHGAGQYAALSGGAAAAARLAGRGDDPGTAGMPPGTVLGVDRQGGLVCVTANAAADALLTRLGVRLNARACALDEAAAP